MTLDVKMIHVGSGVLTLDKDGPDAITIEATEDGGTFAYSRTVQELEIDEVVGPVDHYIDGEEANFTVNCNQFDAERLKLAFGHGEIETIAPDATNAGADVLHFGGSFEINEHTLEYKVPHRKNRNLFIVLELHRVISITEGDIGFTRTAKTGIPMTFRALADPSKPEGQRLGTWRIETAPATGGGGD